MKSRQAFLKSPSSSRLINFILFSSSMIIIYLLVSLSLAHIAPKQLYLLSASQDAYSPTTLEHIVVGIASNTESWPKRQDYVKLWWKPSQMRGCVFLEADSSSTDDNNTTTLPPTCISEDTSKFRYTYRGGPRSAIRLARIVLETVALDHSNVRWFVFGDDDTVFIPENLVKTLSKYDHTLWYYIGSNSEIYEQNMIFGFEMAFGGAGFAISYPLAKVFAKTFDSCIQRYSHLYGSDGRVYSCLTELGMTLTREPGFHQFDVRGNAFGLLASHPLQPLVSFHNIDGVNPIFPNMTTTGSLQHFFKAANVDPERILQKTVCYDRWFAWTISVSWGYAVQVYRNHIHLPDALPVQETFEPWKSGRPLGSVYTFNTRDLDPDPCRTPTIFYMDSVSSDENRIMSTYKKLYSNCSQDVASPWKLELVRVFSQKLDLNIQQLRAPRRQCCDVLPTSVVDVMDLTIRECKEEELIYMH